jgi:hypothetical protein
VKRDKKKKGGVASLLRSADFFLLFFLIFCERIKTCALKVGKAGEMEDVRVRERGRPQRNKVEKTSKRNDIFFRFPLLVLSLSLSPRRL